MLLSQLASDRAVAATSDTLAADQEIVWNASARQGTTAANI
jgi:hypothetical protein